MNIDATFWVSVSFIIFFIILVYLKVPEKINITLKNKIEEIKKELSDADKLKSEAKNILNTYQNQLNQAQEQSHNIIQNAKKDADNFVIEQSEKFYKRMDEKKKSTEEKIKRMQEHAIADIKNISVNISFAVVENLLKNSIDKEKLNNFYKENLNQTKNAFKKITT